MKKSNPLEQNLAKKLAKLPEVKEFMSPKDVDSAVTRALLLILKMRFTGLL
jgi:hypothetical protein